MPQVPVLAGIYADGRGDLRAAYPVNYVPVAQDNGASNGYLRPAEGLVALADVPGIDRGGTVWNGALYRVCGPKLVSISESGAVTVIGNVGDGGPVTFAASFDRLAIASGGSLYYWTGTTLSRVTDPDLGTALCVEWVDGYFVTTDGTSIVVTELNDPASVNPLKYGSAESDPDAIVRVLKVRNELNAVGRYTIEAFQNIGGDLFPFQRIDGARVSRGAVGTMMCDVMRLESDAIVFVGGARGEQTSVWLAASGSSSEIGTREIRQTLAGYSDATLAACRLETRVTDGHHFVYIHLPDRTLVYDHATSKELEQPVWHVLTSSTDMLGQYRAQGWVWYAGRWTFGDPQQARIGYADRTLATHYGLPVSWSFSTQIIQNTPYGGLVHAIELMALPGDVPLGAEPVVWTQYSVDGKSWSMEVPTLAGGRGQTLRRVQWRRMGRFENWRIQRFRGTSDAFLPVLRLDMIFEAFRG